MPALKSLVVTGIRMERTYIDFLPSHFPALRCMHSEGFFYFSNQVSLPETLEELKVRALWESDSQHSGRLWCSLPKNLRVLQLENVAWAGLSSPPSEKITLSCLTELSFTECCTGNELSILQYLDAPCLQDLTMDLEHEEGAAQSNATWVLDLPALTHLKWSSWSGVPGIKRALQQCHSLRSLCIILETGGERAEESLSDFLKGLADDLTMMPLLVDLKVLGASIPRLRNLAQARPWLNSLWAYWRDLNLNSNGLLGVYVEWREYEAFMNAGETHSLTDPQDLG